MSSLSQIGLACSPRQQQAEAHLLPWCCIASFKHIIKTVDVLAEVKSARMANNKTMLKGLNDH